MILHIPDEYDHYITSNYKGPGRIEMIRAVAKAYFAKTKKKKYKIYFFD